MTMSVKAPFIVTFTVAACSQPSAQPSVPTATVEAVSTATPAVADEAKLPATATAAVPQPLAEDESLPDAPTSGGSYYEDGGGCWWRVKFDLSGFKCPPKGSCMPPNPPPPMRVKCKR
jgi:hypothetical protein